MDHRQLGVDLYNGVWPLLEQPTRTPDEDAAMVHMAHASAYHWSQVGKVENFARSEYLCARVYSTIGRPEPALWHAQRCLEHALQVGDWDVAAAQTEMARAHLVAGDVQLAKDFIAQGRACPIADADDREVIEKDLDELEATFP